MPTIVQHTPDTILQSLFTAAVAAATPAHILAPALPSPPKGKTIVIGAGKGVAQLAKQLEHMWPEPLSGIVVTRYGHGCSCQHIRVLEAAHPLPDTAGLQATQAICDLLENAGKDDLIIALFCGGGSALLPAPPKGFTLQDEITLYAQLLASGAPIRVMNAIRSFFSTVKAGRLAIAAYPAPVVSLVVSDIPGDDLALVASGPTIASCIDRQNVLDCIHNYAIDLPTHIYSYIERTNDMPPHPSDSRFANNRITCIASASLSLQAAVQKAKSYGVQAVILADSIEGEARDVAKVHAAIAKEIIRKHRPFTPPVILLSGGETTVTLANRLKNKQQQQAKGGRNTEFSLAFAIEIADINGISALAADTDGIDGNGTHAGAFVTGESFLKIQAAGYNPAKLLAYNDSYRAFSVLDDLFFSGPTGTNVNDFRAIYIHGDYQHT